MIIYSCTIFRDATATISFVNDYATLAAVQNVTAAVYAHVKDEVPNMDFILFLVPMPKISETYAAARGGNALGLSNRDKDLIGDTP